MQKENDAIKTIKQNNFLYREILKIPVSYFEKKNYEKTLEWIAITAAFAWQHHPGFFADGRIENMALEIGSKLDDLTPDIDSLILPKEFLRASSKKKIIHIATTVFDVGGHTRLIKNWINFFDDFEHYLLLTNQSKTAIPDFLAEAIERSGGSILSLPVKAKLIEKAQWVRQAVCPNFNYVILHHHPSDVVPTVALATENCPPIAAVNHADHVFWLGSSVSDLVVDFCRSGEDISQNRRFAQKTTVVPYLMEFPHPTVSRAEARNILGIGEAETVLITIGSSYKYKPTAKHNFFATAKKILERNEDAKLFFVGVNENQAAEKDKRMIFLGVVSDPTLYQIAADIYLDGFPIGGGVASVETVLLNNCPVFAYGQSLFATARRLLEFENVVEADETEQEYISQVSELIQNSALRTELTKKVKTWITSLHSRDKLPEYAEATFGYLDKTIHRPQPIPNPSPEFEEADISLAIMSNLRRKKYPGVLESTWQSIPAVTLSKLLSLLVLSIQSNDTKISRTHMRSWLAVLKRKLIYDKYS